MFKIKIVRIQVRIEFLTGFNFQTKTTIFYAECRKNENLRKQTSGQKIIGVKSRSCLTCNQFTTFICKGESEVRRTTTSRETWIA